MTVLRATDVRFERDGRDLVEPFSLVLMPGDLATIVQPTKFAASLAARLCGAIVKPTSGSIFVGDYETRLQPPEAKRRVGFVDADGFVGDGHAFACEVAFHAACWNVGHARARERADAALAELPAYDAYARAVALALIAEVDLVVLDRPPEAIARAVAAIVPHASILVSAT